VNGIVLVVCVKNLFLMQKIAIPNKSLKRLAHYQFYLRQLEKRNRDFVSNERLATDLNLKISDVREDLENYQESLSMSDVHSVENLLSIIEKCLGNENRNTAILIGAGNLGKALLQYPGFKACGLDIVAVFEKNRKMYGQEISGKEVFSIDRLEELTQRLKVGIGIIATPPEPAQSIANSLISAGVKGIWNFSLAVLKVPNTIALRNTSLTANMLVCHIT
jgi:redox-sensing transcriptional repressor